jgi:hypothetical protein
MYQSLSRPILVFGIIAISLSFNISSSYAESIAKSNAFINVLSEIDSKSDKGVSPVARSTAYATNASALFEATNFSLISNTVSSGVSLSFGSHAFGGFETPYRLDGNPNGLDIPLTFNFSLVGKSSASTWCVPELGCGYAGTLFDYNLVNYDFSPNSSPPFYTKTGGGFQMLSHAGGLVYYDRWGNLGVNSLGAVITPNLKIGAEIKKIANKDLEALGISPDLRTLDKDFDLGGFKAKVAVITGILISAIGNRSLSRTLNLPEGIEAEISADIDFDIDYAFDATISLQQKLNKRGLLTGYMNTQADSTWVGGEAKNNFKMNLDLRSVTIDEGYDDIDLSNLKIVLDSGEIIPISKKATGTSSSSLPPVESTSVPTPILLPSLIGFSLGILRKRKEFPHS